MKIALASDHAGYALKTTLIQWLDSQGYGIQDLGTDDCVTRVDYPLFGQALARTIVAGEADRGIAICGTGIGISIAANRLQGVRAALCCDGLMARLTRAHNDANILCLGARMIGEDMAKDIVHAFLTTDYEGGRHVQRVAQLDSKNE